jgi:hypothetical protein
MAKKVTVGHWSYAEDRRLMRLAPSLKSVEAVAAEMKRSPVRIKKMAKRLGISLRAKPGLKAKTK